MNEPRKTLELELSGQKRVLLPGGGPFCIGRAPDNDLVLMEPRVSSHHAIIEPTAAGWFLRDLGSRNGCYVNTRRVQSAFLEDGDLLSLATVNCSVRLVQGDSSVFSQVEIVGRTMGQRVHSKVEMALQDGFLPETDQQDEALLRRDYEKLRIAHELSRWLGVERDIDRLLDGVVSYCMKVLPADHAVALLMDQDTNEAKIRALRSRSEKGERIPISRSVVRRVLKTGDALLLEDISQDDSLQEAPSLHSAEIRSLLVVPLTVKGQVRGMLVLDNRSVTAAFESKDLHLLMGVAGQASLALERSDLVSRIEEEVSKSLFLSRFLSPALVDEVRQGQLELGMQPQLRHVVILFADMRGFTAFAEREGPSRTAEMLNEHFTSMERVVFENGGILDKFVGDAMMAIWGYPERRDDDAQRALDCALVMQRRLSDVAAMRRARGLDPVGAGVALHAGEAVVGCIGSENRMDFTAIGDTVNLAARLSGVAGPGEVVVSAEVMQAASSGFTYEPRPRIQVKGRQQAVDVYCVEKKVPASTDAPQ